MTDTHEPYAAAPPAPGLEGLGLRLRPWDPESAADVDAWLRGHVDPEFQRWNTPLRTITDTATARESLRAKTADVAAGTSAIFCVTDADDGTILGQVGLNVIDRVQSFGNIGYWVLPEARGHQVATRALLLATRWAYAEVGLHRLELGHALGHEASCRIAERCGCPVLVRRRQRHRVRLPLARRHHLGEPPGEQRHRVVRRRTRIEGRQFRHLRVPHPQRPQQLVKIRSHAPSITRAAQSRARYSAGGSTSSGRSRTYRSPWTARIAQCHASSWKTRPRYGLSGGSYG
ncbi:hypothetical protein SAURM35S_09681 [Streptomyces aurantiogriseus]